jgi:hypothetical protein
MDIEQLARTMRERALLIDSDESLHEGSLRNYAHLQAAKQRKLEKVAEIKKLYFNAGRWVGGARDWTARKAFEQMQAQER